MYYDYYYGNVYWYGGFSFLFLVLVLSACYCYARPKPVAIMTTTAPPLNSVYVLPNGQYVQQQQPQYAPANYSAGERTNLPTYTPYAGQQPANVAYPPSQSQFQANSAQRPDANTNRLGVYSQ
ncbi:hypothetical protein HDU80_007364 [Chytriomyces hyalinus]|nr:hypothetical protein HDU80_007364 [Chytriomyces hyalinus]